jgi:hypothetical protein
MRGSAPGRRLVGLPVAIVAALALLLQVVASPGAFPAPADGLLALGSICHAATGDDGDKPPPPLQGRACDHCLLCHAGNFSFALPPPGPRLAVPAIQAVAAAWLRGGGSRSVARPAYASRAPPTIG